MKRFLALSLALFCAAAIPAAAQMTDSQVADYVKNATKAGKSQTEISRDLIARGVTMEQVNRLKEMYAEGSLSSDGGSAKTKTTANSRQNKKATSDRKPLPNGQRDYRRYDSIDNPDMEGNMADTMTP